MTHQLTLNNNIIETRDGDNYVNATQLCKAGGKKFNDWYRLEATKELIRELEKMTGLKVADVKQGRYHSGSWIHPDLAVPLAQWISPTFALQVSQWVREWRTYTYSNEERYQKALTELKPSLKTLKEKSIQLDLQRKLHGDIEVETPAGFIDLMNDEMIVEIKEYSNWKHAIGQVLSYGLYYPDKQKYICLFGEGDNNDTIETVCSKYAIKVMYA
jgi:hypothetical protein